MESINECWRMVHRGLYFATHIPTDSHLELVSAMKSWVAKNT